MFWTVWQWVGLAYGAVLAALLVGVLVTCAGAFTGPNWHRAAIAPFEVRVAERIASGPVGLSMEDHDRVTAIRARLIPLVNEVDDTHQRMRGLLALMGREPDRQQIEQLTRLNEALCRRVERRMDAGLFGADTVDRLARKWSSHFRREKARAQMLGIAFGVRKSLTSFSDRAAHATSLLAVWSAVTALVLWALIFGRGADVPDFDWLAYVGGWGAFAAALGILHAIVRTGQSVLRAHRVTRPSGFSEWVRLAIGFAWILVGLIIMHLDTDGIRLFLDETLALLPRPSDQALFSGFVVLGAAYECYRAIRAWRSEVLKLSERIRSVTRALAILCLSSFLVTLPIQGAADAGPVWLGIVAAIVGFGIAGITMAERRERRNMEFAIPPEKLAQLPRRASGRATGGAAIATLGPLAIAALWPSVQWSLLGLPLFMLSMGGFGLLVLQQRRRSSYESSLAELYERTQLSPSSLHADPKGT